MRIGRSHFNKDDYVSYNPVTKKSTCLLCKKVLSGIVIHNIKRHYDRVHGVPMVKRFRRPSNTTTPKAKNKATTAVTATPLEDTTIVPPTTSNSEAKKLNLNKNEFLKCCVGLVTVNNLPLRIFDDKEFFKKLIGIYEEEFHLDLNSKNIIESVEFWSDQVKQKLKGKLHQKLLCLSIDVANRMKENVATINVHLMERYRIMTYTLGVVELKSKFRSHFLKDEILKCLREYDIELKQVYSITGDSRGCSIAALKLLQQESESEQYENDMEMEEEFESSNADNFGKSTFFIIKHGYHAIKLVVHALLDTVEANLQECRTLVGLITEKYGGSSDTTTSMPSLDNTSRWESTYEMIFALKEFLTHYEMGFKIEWSFVESFIEAIRPFIELTKLLDSRDYIIGDFYRDWLVCEVKLKKMVDNECAGKLLPIMMDMKQKMINNEAFNAALYLDPRFNYKDTPYFNEERRKMAVVSRSSLNK